MWSRNSTNLLLLLKSVELDDDVALLLGVAGLVMGPQVTCLWLCGSCVTSYTSFFRGSDPAI